MGHKTTTIGTTSSQNSGQSRVNPIEDPTITAFRKQLIPQVQSAINRAQTPLYGEGQKATYLGGLNDLANASISNLRQILARSGAMESGRFSQGATDILRGKNANFANFLSQIPMLNRQAENSSLFPLFGLAESLMASAPKGQESTFSGKQSGESSQTTSSPWWSGLADKLISAGLTAATGLPVFQPQQGGGNNNFASSPSSTFGSPVSWNPYAWGPPPTIQPPTNTPLPWG